MKLITWKTHDRTVTPHAAVPVVACEHVDCRIPEPEVPEFAGLMAANDLWPRAGMTVMLRNIFGPRDEPLDKDAQEKWCAGFLSQCRVLHDRYGDAPRIICIDHARFTGRRSAESQAWMQKVLLTPLQEALPDTIITMYGVEWTAQTWFRHVKPEGGFNNAYTDPELVPWIRAIGAVNGEDQDGDGHADRETLQGFTHRLAMAAMLGHEQVVVWFDDRDPPTASQWIQMFNAAAMVNNVAMQPVPPSKSPWWKLWKRGG